MAENKDTTKCAKCHMELTKDDASIGCDGCPLLFHSGCTPLGVTEAKALNSKKGNLLWMCDICRFRLQKYGLRDTTPKDEQAVSQNTKTCEELKKKMDDISETLMTKMSLLLETQLQQTEILTSVRSATVQKEKRMLNEEENRDQRPTVIKQGLDTQHTIEEEITSDENIDESENKRKYAKAIREKKILSTNTVSKRDISIDENENRRKYTQAAREKKMLSTNTSHIRGNYAHAEENTEQRPSECEQGLVVQPTVEEEITRVDNIDENENRKNIHRQQERPVTQKMRRR